MNQVSALEELDKCIAEFDHDQSNMIDQSKSFTTVSDLSTSHRIHNHHQQNNQESHYRDLSISAFIEDKPTPATSIAGAKSLSSLARSTTTVAVTPSQIMESTDMMLDVKNYSIEMLSPDLNNNNESMLDANTGIVPPAPPMIASSLALTTTPITENNFGLDYKNFMLKQVKKYTN